MASLSVAIMAHPQRQELVHDLLDRLDNPGWVEVSWDDEGPPSNDRDRRWRTGRRAWLRFNPYADWHLVLQDDALPSGDLLATMENALDHVRGPGPVLPYMGSKRPAPTVTQRVARDADRTGASWIRFLRVHWGVAIAVQTSEIEQMIERCDRFHHATYDIRIGAYFQHVRNVDTWVMWPSIVDHRRDTPSLIARSDEGRHARRFHAGSALDLRWDGPAVDDPRLGRRDKHPSSLYGAGRLSR